jgi:hypothetical protein
MCARVGVFDYNFTEKPILPITGMNPKRKKLGSIFLNKYRLSIFLQNRFVIYCHDTFKYVYASKYTPLYFKVSSVLREK